jgi:hypothetical protein
MFVFVSQGTAIAKHSELSTRTPVILAGHDHEQFIEDAGKSVLVKVILSQSRNVLSMLIKSISISIRLFLFCHGFFTKITRLDLTRKDLA